MRLEVEIDSTPGCSKYLFPNDLKPDLTVLIMLTLFSPTIPVFHDKDAVHQSLGRLYVIAHFTRAWNAHLGTVRSLLLNETWTAVQQTTKYDVVGSVCYGCWMHTANS